MVNNPGISVIMSVCNGEKYLGEAIESILNQTYTNYEFIIVNDGSTDETFKIIKSYNDNRIRIVNNETNVGLTMSLNKAIGLARGDYIARQDADDISLPERFEEQIKYLDEHPETVLLGTSIYEIDEHGKVLGRVVLKAKPGGSLLKRNHFSHGSTMFRKEVFNKLGGYNALFRYSQDYDLWLRMARCNDVRNLTRALYKLRFHGGNIRSLKAEESALYHLLAVRLIKDELDEEILGAIKSEGIMSLYDHLTRSERICFHTTVADVNMINNNMDAARKGYVRVFSLSPFNIRNNLMIILSCLGKGTWAMVRRVYKSLMIFSASYR